MSKLLTLGVLQQGSKLNYLLLDKFQDATIAFSLRKLRNEYTGAAIRVRRSTDNAEQDIGFTGSNLDASALLTFVGSGNGFVTKWYDQSGNTKDASMSTALKQPTIVSSGNLIMLNDKISMLFDGTDDEFIVPDSKSYLKFISDGGNSLITAVFSRISEGRILGNDGANSSNVGFGYTFAGGKLIAYIRNATEFTTMPVTNDAGSISLNNQYIVSFVADADNAVAANRSEIIKNNLPGVKNNFKTGTPSQNLPYSELSISSSGNGTSISGGYIQEVLIYNHNDSAVAVGLNTEINKYYKVY